MLILSRKAIGACKGLLISKKELDSLKRIFILAVAAIMLCSCGAPAENDNTVINEIDRAIQDESTASTGGQDEGLSETPAVKHKPLTVKTVRYDSGGCVISMTVPESWNDFVVEEDGIIEPQHIGIQFYDGEVPEQKELYGGKLFVAVAVNGRAQTHVEGWQDTGTPFVEETYTTDSGAGMKLYYIDGQLDFATFDDRPELCVFFDLDDGDSVDDILEIVDTVKYESGSGEAATLDEDVPYDEEEYSLIIKGYRDYWTDYYSDLKTRPEGKEVTIFADNTFDCDYSGYKKIGYGFGPLYRSVMAPEGWKGFRFYRDHYVLENELTGIPIYDGDIPVRIMDGDLITYRAAGPMEKSTFFLAESAWVHAQDFIKEYIDKFDHEAYTDKKGRTMQVYFLDGLPKYACYDDYYGLCIWFNLKSEEQIPIVVNMINSVDVSLSSDAEWALEIAERFGYTIIPPEE